MEAEHCARGCRSRRLSGATMALSGASRFAKNYSANAMEQQDRAQELEDTPGRAPRLAADSRGPGRLSPSA